MEARSQAIVGALLTAFAALLGRLPATVAPWLGGRLGDALFLAMPRRRRLALANLARAFPELPEPERRRLCRDSYRHLGLTLLELCGIIAHPLDRVLSQMTVDGLDHLTTVMESRGRALILTGHLGNWELLSVAQRVVGFRFATVVRPLDFAPFEALARRLREKAGVELIDKRRALRPAVAALRRGDLVAILLDQNTTRRESVFVPFFGEAASTSKSIAVLALRTGTPILPVFIRREAWGRHRVVIHPALEVADADDGADAIVELTTRCTAAIERAIRDAPDQWLWIHNRWRTRPLIPTT